MPLHKWLLRPHILKMLFVAMRIDMGRLTNGVTEIKKLEKLNLSIWAYAVPLHAPQS
jgi:hypothetical protein